MILLEEYKEEREIEYRGEKYLVRDNGAIMRLPKTDGTKRRLDNKWSFGTLNKDSGYLYFSSEPVHRIVACAFIYNNDKTNLVVDHIDTNKQNNRASNLRWVTRLENLVLNEITRTKVELLCHMSIEEILKDMSVLQKIKLPQNLEWMGQVTKEEAVRALENWGKWVSEKQVLIQKGAFPERIIKSMYNPRQENLGVYPLEPTGINLDLKDYFNKLQKDLVFYEKRYSNNCYQYKITDFAYNKKENYIAVATSSEGGIKSLFVTYIRRINDKFEYETRSFFLEDAVNKYMTLARNEKWSGGEVFDDYC